MSRENEPRKRGRLGRRVGATLALTAALSGPGAAVVASEAMASDSHKPAQIQLDVVPQQQGLQLDLQRGTVRVPAVSTEVTQVAQQVPDVTNVYAVETGDTMNSVSDAFLEGALGTEATANQEKVSRAVLEAANPQVTDRNLLFADRTMLNVPSDAVSSSIAQAAEGHGPTALVNAVQEVIQAPTLDDRREEAVDVLQAVGITPTRAEDRTPAPEVPPVPVAPITVAEIDAARTTGVLTTLELEKSGDSLWNSTETVLEEGIGHAPTSAEINPANRIEQVVNTTLTPDIDFTSMPVDAEYVGLSRPATTIIGAVASVDNQVIQDSNLPQEVKDGVNAIQELNEQSPADTVTNTDMAATRIILSMHPSQLSPDIMNQIGTIYNEPDEQRKAEMLVALLSNSTVNDAIFGDGVPDTGGQGGQGDQGQGEQGGGVQGGDGGSGAGAEPGSGPTDAPTEDGSLLVPGLIAGGAILGLGAVGGGLLWRRNRRRNAQETEAQRIERIAAQLESTTPMTEDQERDFLSDPDNSGMPLPNSYSTTHLREVKDILVKLQGINDIKVDAERVYNEQIAELGTDPVPDKLTRQYRIAHRVRPATTTGSKTYVYYAVEHTDILAGI